MREGAPASHERAHLTANDDGLCKDPATVYSYAMHCEGERIARPSAASAFRINAVIVLEGCDTCPTKASYLALLSPSKV